jgi:hypothetical protein
METKKIRLTIEQMVQTYLAAWNEHDPQTRRVLLEQCAAEDILIINEHEQLEGRPEVLQRMAEFRRARPADRAVLTSRIETVQSWFRFTAEVIRPDGTSYSQILEIGELGREGKIVRMVAFRALLPPVLNS